MFKLLYCNWQFNVPASLLLGMIIRWMALAIAFFSLQVGYAQMRTTAFVEQQLQGSWQVADMVISPGKPFEGSKADKDLWESLRRMLTESTFGKHVFTFAANHKYTIQLKDDKGRPKIVKGTWSVEKDGDELILKEGKKSADRVKILTIDDDDLELLFQFDEPFMLVMVRAGS